MVVVLLKNIALVFLHLSIITLGFELHRTPNVVEDNKYHAGHKGSDRSVKFQYSSPFPSSLSETNECVNPHLCDGDNVERRALYSFFYPLYHEIAPPRDGEMWAGIESRNHQKIGAHGV